MNIHGDNPFDLKIFGNQQLLDEWSVHKHLYLFICLDNVSFNEMSLLKEHLFLHLPNDFLLL